MLTDTAIKRLKPSATCTPNKPDKHSDGNGLQLWVRHTGAKKWIVAYRYHGKQTNITLGDYPTISLQQARLQALEIKEKLAQGINPKTAKPNSVLFGDMASEYHTQRDPQHPIKPNATPQAPIWGFFILLKNPKMAGVKKNLVLSLQKIWRKWCIALYL